MRPWRLGHSSADALGPFFRTLKYRPNFPTRPFAGLDAAFPDDRHFGRHEPILSARRRVYEAARRRHPERWSGKTRAWDPVAVVCLNPERDSKAKHA